MWPFLLLLVSSVSNFPLVLWRQFTEVWSIYVVCFCAAVLMHGLNDSEYWNLIDLSFCQSKTLEWGLGPYVPHPSAWKSALKCIKIVEVTQTQSNFHEGENNHFFMSLNGLKSSRAWGHLTRKYAIGRWWLLLGRNREPEPSNIKVLVCYSPSS